MAAIDATVLTLFLRPESGAPLGIDGKPVEHAAARVEYLIETLSEAGEPIIIPTPALSEALVRADPAAAIKIVTELQKHAAFRVEPSMLSPPLNWHQSHGTWFVEGARKKTPPRRGLSSSSNSRL